MKSEKCPICWTDLSPDDPIFACTRKGCGLLVHSACYGARSRTPGTVLGMCIPCMYGANSSTISCELCPTRTGPLKRTADGRWGHIVCVQFIPNCKIGDPLDSHQITLKPLQLNLDKNCFSCWQKGEETKATTGACISCIASGCLKSFHVTCAQRAGLLCLKDKSVYCFEHYLFANNRCPVGQIHVKPRSPPSNPVDSSNSTPRNQTQANPAVNPLHGAPGGGGEGGGIPGGGGRHGPVATESTPHRSPSYSPQKGSSASTGNAERTFRRRNREHHKSRPSSDAELMSPEQIEKRMMSDLKAYLRPYANVKEKLDKEQKKRETVTAEKESFKTANESLKNANEMLGKKYRALVNADKIVRNDLDAIKICCVNLEKENLQLKKNGELLRGSLRTKEDEISSLRGHYDNVQEKDKTMVAEVNTLTAKVQQQKETIDSQRQDIREAVVKLEVQSQQKMKLQQDFDELTAKTEADKSTAEELVLRLPSVEKMNENVNNEKKLEVENEKMKWSTIVNDLNQEKEKLILKGSQLEADIVGLKSDILRINDDRGHQKEKMNRLEKQCQKFKDMFNMLNAIKKEDDSSDEDDDDGIFLPHEKVAQEHNGQTCPPTAFSTHFVRVLNSSSQSTEPRKSTKRKEYDGDTKIDFEIMKSIKIESCPELSGDMRKKAQPTDTEKKKPKFIIDDGT